MAVEHSTHKARQPKQPCTCRCCGKEYTNKIRSKTEGNKYCSRACAFKDIKAWRRVDAGAVERAQKEQRISLIRSVLRKLKTLRRIMVAEAASADSKLALAAAPCAVCGGPCGYLFGRGRKFCSAECRKQSDEYKASKRKYKQTRAIRKRGIVADVIDPISVFKRDRWFCHLCHKKLKRADRGTTKDSAPELEHIIALSDGGTHTWGNVACSCRKCNSIKGAVSRGQTGFSFAVGRA